MDIYHDDRVVLTLDAGGTNFVFNAFKSGKAITNGIRKDSNADHLEKCLATMKEGFSEVIQSIDIEEDRFGFEPEITAKIARGGYRIYEVGISYYGRTYEEGKKIGWKDGFRAIYAILKYNIWHR